MATQTKIPHPTVSNPWWGHDPSDKQLEALWAYEECPDLFYGGAAGPGKTSYLLMAAVQYVEYPHYRALILRKTYADLSLPDAIMDRAISWWDGVEGARFSHADKTCYFPSGARVQFGYMASVRDHLRYQGAAVHFVGIDEASQIPSRQLEYLHSRIRRAIDDPIPLRYRLASNPGDVSHDWLKDTYVNGADGHRVVYLPGLMTDNPGLDVEEYRKQLAHLDPVTRKQLEEGDWDVQLSGGVLDVTRLKYFTAGEFGQRVRYWDFAATEQKEGVDPDWTAGVLMAVEDGEYQVQDVQRFREGPAEVEVRVKAQAQIDGPSVPVRIEQEPGSAGKIVIDHYARHVLPGSDFRGVRSSGPKPERARPLAASISNGLVSLRSEAPWVRDLVNEMRSFPLGTHDDQVDGMSGVMTALTQQDRVQSVLPRSMVQLCVDAHHKYEREIVRIIATERPFVGFRIAESGAGRTSMVTRRGPVIVAAEQWDESNTAALERVDEHCREGNAAALYYDTGGSGASIRATLRQMWQERGLPQSYRLTGVNFGGVVEGAKTEFVRGQTNAQYFARRSSQLGWSLRLRAVRTKRLMEGEDIDLSTYLVITPAIEGLERFLAQLSQPEFDETSTGKVEIPTSTTCAGIRLTGAMLPWPRTWPWWWALQRSRIWGARTGMPAWTGAPWIG